MPICPIHYNGVLHLLLLSLVLCQLAVSAQTTLYNEPRLPVDVVPFHYELRLITHLENSSNFRYEGAVNISIYVQKATAQAVLHVGRVTVEARNITLHRSEGVNLTMVQFNVDREYMILTFHRRLTMGKSYVLSMQFGRALNEHSEDGYFLGHYANAGSRQRKWYTMALFERNFIRNTMPSFDEPSLRATFNVTMGHHKRFQSFSNMNVRAILPNPDLPDYVWSVHEMTPAIPTHLLTFSVNNFTCRFSQVASTNPVRFRTCSRADDVPETSFAADVAPQLLLFFEERLQVRLPLDKIDQLVVDKLPSPALQSLGLVAYRGKEVLQRGDGPMTRAKMLALQVVAHEMAHMWFGNLLGIDWWSDVWLKEGLSGYFEALGVDHLTPGLGRRLLLRYRQTAFMHEEQLGGLTLAPQDPTKLAEPEAPLFQKATALVDMLNGFLGNETFYDGIQRHLWQNSFASSTPDLFWRSLQLALERQPGSLAFKQTLKSVMDTWTQQNSYPLVTVTRNGTAVFLTQSPAFNESGTERWWIPITFTVQAEADFVDIRPKAWMSPLEQRLKLSVSVPEDQWIVLNLHARGYYRVQYDELTLQLLAETLFDNFRRIHVLSRAQIVSDVLFLRLHRRISWASALNVLKYIVDEDEHEPLTAFVVGVTHGYWGFTPEGSMSVAKWLGIAGKWYAEFICHTFDKFVLQENLNSLDYQD